MLLLMFFFNFVTLIQLQGLKYVTIIIPMHAAVAELVAKQYFHENYKR